MSKKLLIFLAASILSAVSCQYKKANLEVSANPSTVAAAGGDVTLTVVTNGHWTIAPYEGTTVTPDFGDGNATVHATIGPNTSDRKRTLKFCFVSTIEYSSVSVTATVTQPNK